jgi:tripartite-type tricarboxylate transporter receptor subunit TctC
MKRCRQFLLGLAASLVTLSAASVWAQGARTIRIVVPFPPGGAADFLARVLAEEVGHGGPSVIVENRPGAGSVVGTDAVARAAPDGTTLLLDSKESLINPHLRKVGYDPLTSFESICRLVVSPTVISVNSRSPYRTFADLVGAAHAKPGQLTLAGSGPASPFQIGFEVLKRAAMMDMTFVPYQGAAPAVSALLGEHVTSALTTYSTGAVPGGSAARPCRSLAGTEQSDARCACRQGIRLYGRRCRNLVRARGAERHSPSDPFAASPIIHGGARGAAGD